jgi:hypothetical protein
MTKTKNFLRKYGFLFALIIIVIGGLIWAYSGYKELKMLIDTYHTPVILDLPTAIPVTDIPQPTQNALLITEAPSMTPTTSNTSPSIPEELTIFLGEHLYPVYIEGEGWRLIGLSGKLYYYWDDKTSTWYSYPGIKDRYCSFPVVSFIEDEQWDSVCYLNFSGLGLTADKDIPSHLLITIGVSGNIQLLMDASILYNLVLDPLQGYRWVETSQGYLKRVSAAAQLIAEIDPQVHLSELNIPNNIGTETYATDISITARYIGSVDHQIVGKDNQNYGNIMLHLFARNQNSLFWISGEGRVLGIKIGLPYSSWDYNKSKDVISYLEDSTDILKTNYRYQFFFFASRYVSIVPNTEAIDLNQFNEMTLIDRKIVPPEPWMTKQLFIMLKIYDHINDWIDNINGETDNSPTNIIPYYYIKIP